MSLFEACLQVGRKRGKIDIPGLQISARGEDTRVGRILLEILQPRVPTFERRLKGYPLKVYKRHLVAHARWSLVKHDHIGKFWQRLRQGERVGRRLEAPPESGDKLRRHPANLSRSRG